MPASSNLSRDGSVIYGNNEDGMRKVREFKDGRLRIAEDGLLEHDEKGIPISGDVRNCWAGFSLLQALFVKEHNAVCDMLKASARSFSIFSFLVFPVYYLFVTQVKLKYLHCV